MRVEAKSVAGWAIRGLGGVVNLVRMQHDDGCIFDETLLDQLGQQAAELVALHAAAVERSRIASYNPRLTAYYLKLAGIDNGQPQQVQQPFNRPDQPAEPAVSPDSA
jgi:hypothetical protein